MIPFARKRWFLRWSIIGLAIMAGCGSHDRTELARLEKEQLRLHAELAELRAELKLQKQSSPQLLDELERLDSLRTKGVLTVEEFEARKQKLLGKPLTTVVAEKGPTGSMTMDELAKQLRTLQSLYQTSVITMQEHGNKKAQLLGKPIALSDLKTDLNLVQTLYNETAISMQERDGLKKKLLEIDPNR